MMGMSYKSACLFIFVVLYVDDIQGKEDDAGELVSYMSKNNTEWQCNAVYHARNINLAKEVIRVNYTCDTQTGSMSIKVWTTPTSKIPSIKCVNVNYVHKPGFGYYKYHQEAMNWTMARRKCQEECGYLAVINSRGESNLLIDMFKEKDSKNLKDVRFLFVGFHDLFLENEYITIQGEPLESTGYIEWSPGQPDNHSGVEHCGSIYLETGKLNDLNCANKKPFVCERETA